MHMLYDSESFAVVHITAGATVGEEKGDAPAPQMPRSSSASRSITFVPPPSGIRPMVHSRTVRVRLDYGSDGLEVDLFVESDAVVAGHRASSVLVPSRTVFAAPPAPNRPNRGRSMLRVVNVMPACSHAARSWVISPLSWTRWP